MSYPIYWVPSPKYTPGHPAPLLAIVHHRMVGTLVGTDASFTSPVGVGRAASTNFGIGWCRKHSPERRICIHQYVRLGDQAWGNGNWDASGSWDNRNPTTLINSRTISIEHEDGGNLPAGEGRGVVPEAVIEASIWLDRELLAGRVDGIRFRDEPTMVRELRAIPVDADHIIDHYYISGRLKPFCYRPWQDDRIGFPQARYLAALGAIPDTSTGDTMTNIEAKIEQWKLDGTSLVTTLGAPRRADGTADYGSRFMLQKTGTGWDLVSVPRNRLTFVDGSLTDPGFAALSTYAIATPDAVTCKPFSDAATAAAEKIAAADVEAAKRSGARAERERIAEAEAVRIRSI